MDIKLDIEQKLAQLLVGKRLTLSTAESCTGGNIAHLITSVAGSSVYYMGGVVSYSNAVKSELLGVLDSEIEHYGAVSEPVVRHMAEGVKRRLSTDCAVATSGIAGPGGGTIDKPVGTIWIAVCTPIGTYSQCIRTACSDRLTNIDIATHKALEMLYYQLLEDEL